MAQFTLEILKNGAWTGVPEGGTIQPSGRSDEIRLKFAHASTGLVIVKVRTDTKQEQFMAPSGSGELSLGTAGGYSAGKFVVYLSSRGGFTGEVISYQMGTPGSGGAPGGEPPRPGGGQTLHETDPVPGGAGFSLCCRREPIRSRYAAIREW